MRESRDLAGNKFLCVHSAGKAHGSCQGPFFLSVLYVGCKFSVPILINKHLFHERQTCFRTRIVI